MGTTAFRNPHEADTSHLHGTAQLKQAGDGLMIALLDHSRDCVKILGIEGTLDFMHCGGVDSLELPQFKHIRGRLWWELWPAHTREIVKQAFHKASIGREITFSAQCPTVQGNLRNWTVTLKPMLTDDGNVAGVLCTSCDKEAADEEARDKEAKM